MAEFLITAPDGKKYKVTGATQEGALAALKKQLGQQPPVQPEQQGPQYDSFGDLVKQRGQQFAQGATEAIAALPEAAAIAGAGNPNAGALVVAETVQKAKDDLAALEKDYQERLAAYKEAGLQPPEELQRRYQEQQFQLRETISGAVPGQGVGEYNTPSNQAYLDAVTNGGEVNLKPDAQDRDLFKAGDTIRQTSEDVFGKPQEGDTSFWGQVAQGGGNVVGMLATGPLAPVAGSAMNSSQLYKEAKDAGASEETAKRAAELGALVGLSDIIPINRALKLLPPRLRGKIGGGLWKRVADIVQAGGEEAAQEYLQTVANNLIAQNLYDPERGWNEGALESALVGAVVGAGTGTVGVVLNNSLYKEDGSVTPKEELPDYQAQAAADVARIIRQEADQNGYNLKKVGASDESGSKKALEATHEKISGQINALAKDPAVRGLLSPKQAASLDQLLEDYAAAQTAIRQGKNKVKSKVTQENFNAIKRLLGPTKEGAQLLNLLHQSNVVTDLFNNGLKGGISQFTDYFNPLETSGGAYDPARTMNLLTSGAGAMTLGPWTTAGIVAGGRAVDAVTGRRSVIDRFVRQNEGKDGLAAPVGPSLIAAEQMRLQQEADAKAQEEAKRAQEEALKAQRAEEQKALNLQLTQQGAPATPESPQYTLEDATGLSRAGVAKILRVLKGSNRSPALVRAITEYEQSVATGGRVSDLSPLIRAVRQFQQENPNYVEQVRPPNSLSNPQLLQQPGAMPGQPNVQTQGPAQPGVMSQAPTQPQFGPQDTTPENYNRGIQDNLNFNRQLQEGAVTDPDLSRVQRGRIITSLENLTSNLGSNPVETAQLEVQKLQEQGVPQQAIDTYVKPYVDRVMQQQASRQGPRGLAAAQAAGVAPTVNQDQTNLADMNDIVRPIQDEEIQGDAARRPLEMGTPQRPLAPRLAPEQIPTQTRKVYKLMKVQKSRPGEVLPLFAKSGGDKGPPSGYTFGEWFGAEVQRPKLGDGLLAMRPGIHAVNLPVFDQGKANVSGEQRVWVEVEMPAITSETQAESDNSTLVAGKRSGVTQRLIEPNESYDYKTNPNASNDAGGWPIAGSMKAVRIVPDDEIAQILRDNGLDHQVENSFSNVDAAKAQQLMGAEQIQGDAQQSPKKPALQTYINPLNVPEDQINVTRLNESPSEADIQKMREGTYKPKQKRSLVEAAGYMHEKWKEATGRDEPFEYTPENVDIISTFMATEAVNALQSDANAIGWYDRKLKAAKRVVSLVDPRVTQSEDAEVAFDFALAITSNGQAVADNFQYALEVFRYYMDNGKMPTETWIKGGKRNKAMVEAFEFFNDYQASGTNMPIQDFLDQDFTVKELKDWAASFNERYKTNIKVPSSEGATEMVKGSFIAGPKIGQGFYQNIRGNYDPLTMDIWWMRMWNRLVGRPYTSEKDLDVNRARVREALKTKNQDALESKLTKETLKEMGITRADLSKDATLDDFVVNLDRKYQRFYSQESKRLKGTGKKVPKPELFNASGTMKDNLSPQLQATPTGPGERSYMRKVTKAAIAKLSDLGYDISTADFQALMWYPEKQLFRHLGVAPGRGADNDYLDAAIMLAEAEGITNDQIQEALPDPNGDGNINNQSDPSGAYENSNRGAGGDGPIQSDEARSGILSGNRDGSPSKGSGQPSRSRNPFALTSLERIKNAIKSTRPAFQIGLKGGEFENGIQNIDDALRLADALGVTVRLFNDTYELDNVVAHHKLPGTPGMLGSYYRKMKRNSFGQYKIDANAKGFEGTVFGLKPHAVKDNGQTVSDTESLMIILHELGHALTLGNIDGDVQPRMGTSEENFPNPITNEMDRAPIGSFARSALYPLVMKSNPKQRDAILQEILGIQDALDAYTTNNPKERVAVRETRRLVANIKNAQDQGANDTELMPLYEQLVDYGQYTGNIRETATDPVWVYLMNPKLAKKMMPKTAALIRSEFDKAKNGKIKFYAHPLAMVGAVVMALLAQREEDDERERQQQQMPPGALNAPMAPGMLSQA